MLVQKPWGSEEILFTSDRYTVKRLTMTAGHCCSLQYHEHKCETIYVIYGALDIMGTVFYPGDVCTIEPGKVHRMRSLDPEKTVYLECSTSELDDVVRIEDSYGRV